MQKVVAFLLLLFAVSGVAGTLVLAKQEEPKPVSPLPEVLAEAVTPTPSETPTPNPTLIPTPTRKPTATPTRKPTPIIATSAQLEELFTKYGSEYSVDKEHLKRIANCESGMNPNAANLGYAGLYQFTETLWIQTRQLMGHNSDSNLRYNPEEAIRTAAFMVAQHHLGVWPNCNT